MSGLRRDLEGYVWVEVFRWASISDLPSDPKPAVWSVFDPDGVWVGDVTVPPRFVLTDVRDDRVLGIHVDSLNVRSIEVWPLRGRS